MSEFLNEVNNFDDTRFEKLKNISDIETYQQFCCSKEFHENLNSSEFYWNKSMAQNFIFLNNWTMVNVILYETIDNLIFYWKHDLASFWEHS